MDYDTMFSRGFDLNEIELIVNQLTQTFDGKAWHGPSLMHVLKAVDRAQASARPIKARHTIWEIVDHCSFWMEAVIKTLKGEATPDFETIKDWTKMGESEAGWDKTLERLQGSYKNIVKLIQNSSETSLATKKSFSFQGQKFTVTHRKMLHGISDHNVYHAGQIAILKPQKAE